MNETNGTFDADMELRQIGEDSNVRVDLIRKVELRAVRVIARQVLLQWPSAKYLSFVVSDQGTDAIWPDEVLDETLDGLADGIFEEDNEEINFAAEYLYDDNGPWTEYRTYPLGQNGSPCLDLHRAARITDAQIAGTIEPH